MAGHAALFKADGLPALWTGLSQEAVLMFASPFETLTLQVPVFKDTGDGVRYGKDETVLLKDRVFTTYPLELLDNLVHLYP